MRKVFRLSGVAIMAAGVAALVSAAAQAQSNRTFVSGSGSDTNNCSRAAPCRSFANAITKTNASGEIVVLDSAGYGPITITQPVTITNPGGVEAGVTAASGGDAIYIAANAGNVTLRGLTLQGAGVGYNGIVVNGGVTLTVANCFISGFVQGGGSTDTETGTGILMQPSSGTVNFTILDTVVSDNRYVGIFYFPPAGSGAAQGTIDHVVAANNGSSGMAFNPSFNNSTGAITVSVSNSLASGNFGGGIFSAGGSGTLTLTVDNTTMTENQIGLESSSAARVLLSRSVVTSNTTGISNGTSPNTLYTFGDNRIALNGTDISGSAPLTTYKPQ